MNWISPTMWLALGGLSMAPFLFLLLLKIRSVRSAALPPFRIGNSIFNLQEAPAKPDLQLAPFVRLVRTERTADLLDYAPALRHLPFPSSAPVLTWFWRSEDPLLQVYAQSGLQQRQETLLQHLALMPQPDSKLYSGMAHGMEAGLQLLTSPSTPESEHPSILQRLLPIVDQVLQIKPDHARLIFQAGRAALVSKDFSKAIELAALLPEGSPFQLELRKQITHVGSILHPVVPITSRYQIH